MNNQVLTVYGIANCDKVRAVLKWCREQQLECLLHDYRRDGLDEALLKQLLQQFDLDTIVNKRSTSWRQLDEKTRQQLDADTLLRQPTLIKRPIVRQGQRWWLGATVKQLAEALA